MSKSVRVGLYLLGHQQKKKNSRKNWLLSSATWKTQRLNQKSFHAFPLWTHPKYLSANHFPYTFTVIFEQLCHVISDQWTNRTIEMQRVHSNYEKLTIWHTWLWESPFLLLLFGIFNFLSSSPFSLSCWCFFLYFFTLFLFLLSPLR